MSLYLLCLLGVHFFDYHMAQKDQAAPWQYVNCQQCLSRGLFQRLVQLTLKDCKPISESLPVLLRLVVFSAIFLSFFG